MLLPLGGWRLTPNSLTRIEGGAFANNPGFTAINVSPNNFNYSSIDGVLYNKNVTTLIQWPAGKTGEIVIPSNVTSVGNRAFWGNPLINVTIGANVMLGYQSINACFNIAYNMRAGTYTKSNATSTIWTKE